MINGRRDKNFSSSSPPGDKSLPPKLELSDSIPLLIHSDADAEPPTLKPIDAAPDREGKARRKSADSDGEIPQLLPSVPHLNGYARDGPPPEGDAVNRRTAVLFRKSKGAKTPGGGDGAAEGGAEGTEEAEEGDEAQLGSKSFLSVVIPRLETLLHKRKRKHNGGRDSEGEEEEGEEDEAPVKRLNTGERSCPSVTPTPSPHSSQPLIVFYVCFHLLTGLSSGFLGGEEEKELSESPSRAGRGPEPRRRCASESSISSSSSLQGSTRYSHLS